MISRGLNPLSSADMQRIHEASLTVLQDTGLCFDHAEVCKRLQDAGAVYDPTTGRVRFPAEMVEKALAATPRELILAGRDPEYDIPMSSHAPMRVRYATGMTAVVDHETGDYRDALLSDQINLAIVTDALDPIDMTGSFTIHGLPDTTADLHAIKTLLQHQRKHFMALTFGSVNMKYQIEMQIAVRGSEAEMRKRPLFQSISCLNSPLHMGRDAVEILLLTGRYGLPAKVPVPPMMGANAPITIAGTVVQANAEVLGSLTLLDTLYPGTPMIYYVLPLMTDMRTGVGVMGSPENQLLHAAFIQMGSTFYQLPTETSAMICDNHLPEQNTFQKSNAFLVANMAGANMVSGVGAVDGGLASSLTQLVIDAEIVANNRRLFEGFEVDTERLAVAAIDRVGPCGNYFTDDHTYQYLRSEKLFRPQLFDWRSYAAWSKDGRGLYDLAAERVCDLLATHEIPPLDEHVVKELERIVAAAEREINA